MLRTLHVSLFLNWLNNVLIHGFLFIITESDEMRHKCLVLLEEFLRMKVPLSLIKGWAY